MFSLVSTLASASYPLRLALGSSGTLEGEMLGPVNPYEQELAVIECEFDDFRICYPIGTVTDAFLSKEHGYIVKLL